MSKFFGLLSAFFLVTDLCSCFSWVLWVMLIVFVDGSSPMEGYFFTWWFRNG
uniref:Uncharacterized protein n=1 Tax=Solanum tuberosum TaxID=4113 RepID=M1BU47_SOLTU